MAKTVEIKIPDDIEFRVIGNALGLLVASAGLLAGYMVRMRDLGYWLDDIVPLLLTGWMAFRLFRTFLATMTVYQDAITLSAPAARSVSSPQAENVSVGQLPATPSYSAEQVVEEVAKRIDAQRAEAERKNKFTN